MHAIECMLLNACYWMHAIECIAIECMLLNACYWMHCYWMHAIECMNHFNNIQVFTNLETTDSPLTNHSGVYYINYSCLLLLYWSRVSFHFSDDLPKITSMSDQPHPTGMNAGRIATFNALHPSIGAQFSKSSSTQSAVAAAAQSVAMVTRQLQVTNSTASITFQTHSGACSDFLLDYGRTSSLFFRPFFHPYKHRLNGCFPSAYWYTSNLNWHFICNLSMGSWDNVFHRPHTLADATHLLG